MFIFVFINLKKNNVIDCIDIVIYFEYYILIIKLIYIGIYYILLRNINFSFMLGKNIIYLIIFKIRIDRKFDFYVL